MVASLPLKHYDQGHIFYETSSSELSLVRHRKSQKLRMLKRVKPCGVARALNEVRFLEILKGHANILKLKGATHGPFGALLVTEICHGGDLMSVLLARTRFPELEAGLLMKQLFLALSQLHSRGLVHRDIRPENILFAHDRPDSQIKLSGFDFACEQSTKPTSMAGSPLYMAPEVSFGRGKDFSRDIWSCGVVLFMLLTSKSLFGGHYKDEEILNTVANTSQAAINKKLKHWQRRRKLSDTVLDLLRQMLSVDPAARPSVADCLAHPWIQRNGWESEDDVDGDNEEVASTTSSLESLL